VKRGAIWLVNLDPTVGSEIRKSRPCLIISPEDINAHLRTLIVAPMTSKGFAASFRTPITHAGTRGLVLLDQIRAIDKKRLVRKMGSAPKMVLTEVLETLQEIFAE